MSHLRDLLRDGVIVAWVDLITAESKGGYIQCFTFKAIPLNVGSADQAVVLAAHFSAGTVVPQVTFITTDTHMGPGHSPLTEKVTYTTICTGSRSRVWLHER